MKNPQKIVVTFSYKSSICQNSNGPIVLLDEMMTPTRSQYMKLSMDSKYGGHQKLKMAVFVEKSCHAVNDVLRRYLGAGFSKINIDFPW